MGSWFEMAKDWAIEYRLPLFVGSLVMFLGTLLATPWLLALIPERYLVEEQRWAVGRWYRPLWLIAKNVLGALLVLVGIPALPAPGQGTLMIVVGVLLLSFPGKRRFEIWLLTRQPIWCTVNRIRHSMGRPPLVPPDPSHGASGA